MEFTMGLEVPFSLDYTLESGQVFRWERKEEWWYGVVSGGVLKIRQEGDTLKCVSSSDLLDSAFVRSYFRLDDDLEGILNSLMKGPKMTSAVQRFYGLRLARQDRWECLASFLLATNSNIPRIKKMIAAISSKYGELMEFEGLKYSRFPTPKSLADASVADLRGCGLGYRAAFLKHASSAVAEGKVDFDLIKRLDYGKARRELLLELFGKKLLQGVGPKVADCALLYSFDKNEAFPIDVWIARVLSESYPRLFGNNLKRRLKGEGKIKLGPSEYERISAAARKHFGEFAGYAQQYLYVAARSAES